jgi:sigma-B regulation protein RsbU (phosphoserine phosphatase)
MPGTTEIRELYRKASQALGRMGIVFLVLAVLLGMVRLVAPGALLLPLLWLAVYISGAIFAVSLGRRGLRTLLWRLRNRLYVTYLFIAVVPVVLIVVLVGIGVWMGTSQMAVYLVTAEIDRRTSSLTRLASTLAAESPSERQSSMRELAPYVKDRFPNLELLVRSGAGTLRFPADSALEPPPAGFGDTGGLILYRNMLCAWGHATNQDTEVTVLVPLRADYLAQLVPGLGQVEARLSVEGITGQGSKPRGVRFSLDDNGAHSASRFLPPAEGRLDVAVQWWSLLPAAVWQAPGEKQTIVVSVVSRPSAVWRIVSRQRAGDELSGTALPLVFQSVAVLFLIVEIVSLFIGVSLTRTITGAIHGIYEGTQAVLAGRFQHRIEVRGNDQLSEVGRSFNQMTENLERLVVVAKEKERLQSELEIAREVQAQLYPKSVPAVPRLKITAGCNPARLVSGDYYDYQMIHGRRVGLALGDVAGKGISAALLMATLQSSLRTQLRACVERAAAADGGGTETVSTSRLVSQLNLQLYADTAPEKFATFFFGVYDDDTGSMVYTNAGHLPPMLFRAGEVITLGVNGMVVGAFPFSQYGETRIELQTGDLVLCYTDGVTEPENEYGEMFGEERLMEVVRRNLDRDNEEIIAAITSAVREWTASPELQDDMTLLVARRL